MEKFAKIVTESPTFGDTPCRVEVLVRTADKRKVCNCRHDLEGGKGYFVAIVSHPAWTGKEARSYCSYKCCTRANDVNYGALRSLKGSETVQWKLGCPLRP